MAVNRKHRDVKNFFELGFNPWEDRYSEQGMVGALYADRQKAVVSMARDHLQHGAAVLDAGCGPGYISKSLEENGFSVVGCDLAFRMARAAQGQIGGGNVLVADMTAPPFRDQSFDAIILIGVIGYVDEPSKLLQGLHRLLKPNGIIILSSANRKLLMSAIGRKISMIGSRRSRGEDYSSGSDRTITKLCTYYPASKFNAFVAESGYELIGNHVIGFGRLHYRHRNLFPEKFDIALSRVLSALQRRTLFTPLGDFGFMNIACFRSIQA